MQRITVKRSGNWYTSSIRIALQVCPPVIKIAKSFDDTGDHCFANVELDPLKLLVNFFIVLVLFILDKPDLPSDCVIPAVVGVPHM